MLIVMKFYYFCSYIEATLFKTDELKRSVMCCDPKSYVGL